MLQQVGFSLQQVLAEGEIVGGDERMQPVHGGCAVGVDRTVATYGVTPDAVIGHSMGEVTAAVVAGALSCAEGLRVIAMRSRLMSRLAGQGAMALLELDAEATEALIADYPQVAVAGVCLSAPDGDRRAARGGGRGDRRGAGRRTGSPAGSTWMWPPITALMDPILPELECGVGRSGAHTAVDSVHLHRARHRHTAAGCRLLGGQRA